MALDGLGGIFPTAAAPANGILYDLATPMTTADYSAIGVLQRLTATATVMGLALRVTASDTYYFGGYSTAAGRWKLLKNVGGVQTDLSTAVAAFTAGTQHQVRIEAIGTTLNLYVDGTLTVTAVDAALAGPGAAGVVAFNTGAESNTTGMHIAEWQAVT